MRNNDLPSAGFAGAIGSWGEAAERAEGPRSVGRGAKPPFEAYVDVILQVAAHLRTRNAGPDVLDCIALLRQDAIAQRIAEVLATPSAE